MSSKIYQKTFKPTPVVITRVLIFIIIVAATIWYLSSRSRRPSVLGQQTALDLINQLYREIPPDKRQQIEKLPTSPTIIAIQEKLGYLQTQLQNFPGQQIEELKESILKSIARDLLKNLQ